MKRIKIFLCAAAFLVAATAHAQTPETVDTSWKQGGFTSLSFTQVSLSNWAAGGEEAYSGVVMINLFSNYAKDKTVWDNSLDLGYGLIKSGEAKAHKNEDKIELNSKYGYKAFGNFFYSGLVNFRSQFTAGYNYPDDSTVVSKFAAPAYLIVALGLDYKPNEFFSVFISPATGKYTLATDQKLADAGAYGVDPAVYDALGNKTADGKTLRSEFGAYFRAKFQKDLATNFNLSTTLALFDNYTDKDADNKTNVDVNWETMLTMKAGKLFTVSLATNLIYDHNIKLPTYETINGVKTPTGASGPKTQFKEVFGIGISYKF
ncbi:MAG: DUF3078 domain-containing protein [Bacteroidia bacterium]|nr:DUF3078 domain-containing protein [Bacteroidia bacterium]